MPKHEERIQADKERLLASLRETAGIVSFACEKAGLSRNTYYRWYSEDSDFKERADDIQELQIDVAEAALLKKIKKEDTTAIIFYLKTKGKNRGYSQRHEITGLDGDEIKIKKGFDLSCFSEEERNILIRIAEKIDEREG